MSKLRLTGSTSGYTELTSPAVGGNNTLVLPTGNGANGQYLQTNGSGALSWATLPTAGLIYTAAAPVSAGTSQYKEFTGIGSDVKRITILVNGASCSGGNSFVMQLGDSGGFETSGYLGSGFYNYSTAKDYQTLSTYFFAPIGSSAHVIQGKITIERFDDANYVYTSTAELGLSEFGLMCGWAGNKQLSDALTQVRVGWTANAFDAGTFRIITEV